MLVLVVPILRRITLRAFAHRQEDAAPQTVQIMDVRLVRVALPGIQVAESTARHGALPEHAEVNTLVPAVAVVQ